MSELYSIVLTAALTVIGGVIVFVSGEIIKSFFIIPIQDQTKLIAEIADSLIFYANVYSNPGDWSGDRATEAATTLRRQAAQLRAKTRAIPWYGFWQLLRVVPKRTDIREASENIIGLSNSMRNGNPRTNDERRTKIMKALKIDF